MRLSRPPGLIEGKCPAVSQALHSAYVSDLQESADIMSPGQSQFRGSEAGTCSGRRAADNTLGL